MRILIVDDDHQNSRMTEFLLSEQGYAVAIAEDARAALRAVEKDTPDLILLDVNLPHRNGFDLFTELRQCGVDAPVIFVSSKGEVDDRVLGLKMGADDYIAKPFQPAELTARVEAVLRRTAKNGAGKQGPLRVGSLLVDPVGLTVTIGDKRVVSLTPTEMRILLVLARHAGQPVTRADLLGDVWGEGYDGASNVVDVYVRRLRRKLEQSPQTPTLLQAKRGVGYQLVEV